MTFSIIHAAWLAAGPTFHRHVTSRCLLLLYTGPHRESLQTRHHHLLHTTWLVVAARRHILAFTLYRYTLDTTIYYMPRDQSLSVPALFCHSSTRHQSSPATTNYTQQLTSSLRRHMLHNTTNHDAHMESTTSLKKGGHLFGSKVFSRMDERNMRGGSQSNAPLPSFMRGRESQRLP